VRIVAAECRKRAESKVSEVKDGPTTNRVVPIRRLCEDRTVREKRSPSRL